ncbi:MAG TPA: GtrA family protein [Marmoricola sp.]|nr:GtrA family protein [Marmoricola sp.]
MTRLLIAFWRREEVRYLIVGGFNTAVGLALYAGFHALLGRQLGYLLVLIPAYAVGIVVSFFTQRYLVFHAHGHLLKDFLRFTSVQLAGLGLNAIVLALVHVSTSLPAVWAQAVSLFVVAIATYFSHKFFSFRRAEQHG